MCGMRDGARIGCIGRHGLFGLFHLLDGNVCRLRVSGLRAMFGRQLRGHIWLVIMHSLSRRLLLRGAKLELGFGSLQPWKIF